MVPIIETLKKWIAKDTATPSDSGLQALYQLFPYDAYDPDNHLYFNHRSIGFILEAAPLTGGNEEMVNILASLLTDTLPDDAHFQCFLWASNKIGGILNAFEQARAGQGEIMEWLAKKRTAFLTQGTKESLSKSGSFILRNFRVFLVVSLPCKNTDETIDKLLNLREDFISSLNSIHMTNRPLLITDFLMLMRELINPSSNIYPDDTPWHELEPISLQITHPEQQVKVYEDHLLFEQAEESWEARCFSVKHFPSPMVQWKMTDSIGQLFNTALQIPCQFLISLHFRLQDSSQANAKVQFNYLDSDKTARSPLSKFSPLLGEQRRDWDYIRTRLAEGDRLVKTFYQVVLYAPTDKMSAAERKLRDLYRANGWKLYKETYMQLQSWLAIFPMMVSEGMYDDLRLLGRLRTMTAFNAVNILPLQGEWKGLRTPSLILPGRRGQIAVWNPFDNPEGNYNVAIAASSGKGKSMFTQEYITSLLGCGGRIWVIDIGRSYEKTCNLFGGHFIEFSTDNPISLNPFTFIENFDESLVMLKPLLTAMARPTSKASDEEIAWIEKALKAAWEEKGKQSTITTVVNWLQKQNAPICANLALLLFSYTKDGMYGRYFEGEASLNSDARFVVLELQELKAKKDLQKIVLLVLMYQIAERMYLGKRDEYKSCVIDEAWDLLGGDNVGAAQFIEAGYRTARRYMGNFVTITQSINDYFKNSTSIAAFENSDNMVILGQKSEAIDQFKKTDRLSMDVFTERLFKSLRKNEDYSECVIKSPSGLSIHRIIFDPFSRILYSSKGVEFEAVKKWQQQGLSLMEAISRVAGEQTYVPS